MLDILLAAAKIPFAENPKSVDTINLSDELNTHQDKVFGTKGIEYASIFLTTETLAFFLKIYFGNFKANNRKIAHTAWPINDPKSMPSTFIPKLSRKTAEHKTVTTVLIKLPIANNLLFPTPLDICKKSEAKIDAKIFINR